MAGALDVRLEKAGHYVLGEAKTPLIPDTIKGAVQLFSVAAALWILICLIAGGVQVVLAT